MTAAPGHGAARGAGGPIRVAALRAALGAALGAALSAALGAALSLCVPADLHAATPCTLDRAVGTTIDRAPFLSGGYSVRWNLPTDRLAFMQPDASGYDRVFTMRPDGTDRRLLLPATASTPGHQGAPYWHPSGAFLLFLQQKPGWAGRRLFGVPDYGALPGFGRHDDLWVANADGRRAWRLTDAPDTPDEGVLAPVFSPDGRTVAWSARQPGGRYAIEIARFSPTPAPHLDDIRTLRPGGPAYYETGSFSSDGRFLLYTGDQDTHSFWRSQIFRLDLATGTATRLTDGRDYNEHPTVIATPAGDRVVFMSTRGVDRFPGRIMLGTDWWVTDLDGGPARRLTTMNVNRPGNPENAGDLRIAGTVAIAPSGTFMLGDVQDSLARQTGFVATVRFVCDR